MATLNAGHMEVTVDDGAKDPRPSRLHGVGTDRRQSPENLAAPACGEQVIADETVVAVMQPTAPSFIDLRSRVELSRLLPPPKQP
jgi:HlyD family secretion protein